MQWKKTMEECEANVHSQIWATVEKDSNMTELNAASQVCANTKMDTNSFSFWMKPLWYELHFYLKKRENAPDDSESKLDWIDQNRSYKWRFEWTIIPVLPLQAQKRKKQKMKAKKEVTALQSTVPEVTPVELRRDLNRMEKRVGR